MLSKWIGFLLRLLCSYNFAQAFNKILYDLFLKTWTFKLVPFLTTMLQCPALYLHVYAYVQIFYKLGKQTDYQMRISIAIITLQSLCQHVLSPALHERILRIHPQSHQILPLCNLCQSMDEKYLTVLICISLITKEARHLSCFQAFLFFCCQKSVYCPLSNFLQVVCLVLINITGSSLYTLDP